eukprot:1135971-Prymnesium_polylepis.3
MGSPAHFATADSQCRLPNRGWEVETGVAQVAETYAVCARLTKVVMGVDDARRQSTSRPSLPGCQSQRASADGCDRSDDVRAHE